MRPALFNLNLSHTKDTRPVSSYVSHSDDYAPLGGGGTSQSYAKEVSARIERSAKQTRIYCRCYTTKHCFG